MREVSARKKTCGEYIREIRLRCGQSLRQTASNMGIAASYLCDIEKDRRPINERTAKLIVKELHLAAVLPGDMYNIILGLGGKLSRERAALLHIRDRLSACEGQLTIEEYHELMTYMREALYDGVLP